MASSKASHPEVSLELREVPPTSMGLISHLGGVILEQDHPISIDHGIEFRFQKKVSESENGEIIDMIFSISDY